MNDCLRIEVSYGLLPFISKHEDEIKKMFTKLRDNVQEETGIKLPVFRMVDSTSIGYYKRYRFLISNTLVIDKHMVKRSVLKESEPIPDNYLVFDSDESLLNLWYEDLYDYLVNNVNSYRLLLLFDWGDEKWNVL